MDENLVENIHYKFELKKLTGDEVLSTNANKTGIRSNLWVDDMDLLAPMPKSESQENKMEKDISYNVLYGKDNEEAKLIEENINLYNDIDLLAPMPNSESQENKMDKDISYSVLYGKDNEEAKLIEENIELYNDLVKIEEEERKAKEIHEIEFQNCKKELKKLRELDVKNKARIEALTKENTNLKTSISSLYRTFKREIEFKDNSLAEANNEVARLTTMCQRRNGQIWNNGKCSKCENNSSDFRKDYNTPKRKRSESPERSFKKREYKSSTSKSYEADLQSEKDKRKTEEKPDHGITDNNRSSNLQSNNDKKGAFHKQILKGLLHDKETQTFNQCVFCLSRQSSNEIFFNLLPDSIKKSIYDYEQDQVNALNKLKEVLINQYLDSGAGVTSSILETTPKQGVLPAEGFTPSRSSETILSSGTMSTPTFSSEICKETELAKRVGKTELDENGAEKACAQSNVSKEHKNSESGLNKKEESKSNKNSENISPSRLEWTPKSSFEHCKRTELAKKFRKDDINKNENEKDCAQNDVSKVPTNCYTSRQIQRDELTSNKNSEDISSLRNEESPSSSSEHFKITRSGRRFSKGEIDRNDTKRHHTRRHTSKSSKNPYNSRQNKKDVISLFSYRKQKIPFEVKKKFGLHKDDQKLIPKQLL